MILKLWFIILFFGVSTFNTYADTGRNLRIQTELNCISQHENSSLTWADVCSVSDYSDDQRNQIIMQALDEQERILHPETITQTPHYPQTLTTAFNDRVNTFRIVPQVFYNHYSEPQKAHKLSGVWDGIEADYIFRPPPGDVLNNPVFNYYAIEALYAMGKNSLTRNETQVDGPTNSVSKLVIKNIPGYMFEDRALLGREFIPLPYFHATPYTGFGIRYKTDQSSGHFDRLVDGSPVLGFNRSETYYYIPTGLTLDLAATKGYEVSLNMEYDYLVKGYEKDDFSDFDRYAYIPLSFEGFGDPPYTSSNLRFSFTHGYGLRSSLKLLKHFSLVDIYFEPYIRFWKIDASKVASGSLDGDPVIKTANKNTTEEIGSSLGVQF